MKTRINKRKVSKNIAENNLDAFLADRKAVVLRRLNRVNRRQVLTFLTLLIYLIGLGSGFLLWGQNHPGTEITSTATEIDQHAEHIALGEQVNPPEGFTLATRYGDVGPQLLSAGAIDQDRFGQVYELANRPLSDAQLEILEQGSQSPVVFNKQNAYFLLNFFWALGLANHNKILTEGPMMQNGEEQIGRFASIGGWTLSVKPATELYASQQIIILTDAQQDRLKAVTMNVYRPCCNNPTHFPDCNHGMAMLGLLELMASQDASNEEMYNAAKYANAFWYPSQYLELAQYFKSSQEKVFADVDSQALVSQNYSSASGFKAVHQWLADTGLLPGTTGTGSSCGV
jgi:hypothetical protein